MSGKPMTFAAYLLLADYIKGESIDALKGAAYGGKLGKREVSASLQGITLGELMQAQSYFGNPATIVQGVCFLSGLTERQLGKCPAQHVISYVNAIARELERIGKLFDACHVPPTPEERKAGVEQLQFGWFGIVDWYCKRMGIISHEYVTDCVKWVEIYKCLDLDAKTTLYERKLQKILYNTQKKK